MPNYPVEGYKINGKPRSGMLDPSNNKTYELTQGILSELNTLFPDNMVHLGGDKGDLSCYDENPKIQEFMGLRNLTSY